MKRKRITESSVDTSLKEVGSMLFFTSVVLLMFLGYPSIMYHLAPPIAESFDVPKPIPVYVLVGYETIPMQWELAGHFWSDQQAEQIDFGLFPTAEAETLNHRIFQHTPNIRIMTTSGGAFPLPCDENTAGYGGGRPANRRVVVEQSTACTSYFMGTTVPPIHPELGAFIDDVLWQSRKKQGESGTTCAVAQIQGVPTTNGGTFSAVDAGFNATALKWSSSSGCQGQIFPFPQSANIGLAMTGTGDTFYRDLITSEVYPNGDPISLGVFMHVTHGFYPNTRGVFSAYVATQDWFLFDLSQIPVDATSGLWQMKEHSKFPTGIMDDCKFSRIGDSFNILSGSTNAEQGQCVVFKVFNQTAVGQPTIELVATASGTGTNEKRIFIDVMDGRFDATTGYTNTGNSLPMIVTVGDSDFFENQLRPDLGLGANHRLGITEVELTAIPTGFTIPLSPNYASGSSNFFTVFVGIDDDSTDGSVSMNITSIQVGDQKYDFIKPDVRFWEETIQGGLDTTSTNNNPILPELDLGFVDANQTTVAPIVAPALPAPKSVISGVTAQAISSIVLDWVHDGINTTGYRIYRTSTESVDTQLFSSTGLADGTSSVVLNQSPIDHISQTVWTSPSLTGQIITDASFRCVGSSATGGFLQGALFVASQTGQTTDATFANSTNTIDVSTLTGVDQTLTFNFRDTGLINHTTSGLRGIGVSWVNPTSGSVSCDFSDTLIGGSEQSRWDGSNWARTNGWDFKYTINKINVTKLSSPAVPLVSDTGSLDTNFTDITTNMGETYFYQIFPLNGAVEGASIVIVNATQPAIPMAVNNFALVLNNIGNQIDLSWDSSTGADEYIVQRLSTERTITTVDNVQGDNNFASGSSFNRPTGDNAGLAEGDIGVEVSLKSGRFSSSTRNEMIGGLWYNVTTGDPNGNRKPDSTSEVEFAGFMASAGTRLSRDCNGTFGFTSLVEQDGYTQRSDGTWFDGACLIENRFLGNQLVNSTGQNNEIGAMWLNGSSSIILIKEAIGSGFTFGTTGDSPTGTWNVLSGNNIELRVLKLNQTFVNVTTLVGNSNTAFSDLDVNNYNTFFYRIIPSNLIAGDGDPSNILNGTLSVRPQRVPDLNATDNGSTVDLIWQEAPIKFSRALSNDPVQGYIIQRAVGNETTVYDGLAFDTEEFFWKSVDSIVTLVQGTGSGSGGSPSFGSNVANGGQILNITQATNITRMVVKIGVSDGQSFNTEPDLAGGIWHANGTAITRSIFPRVANFADMFTWSTDKDDHEGFVNWVFSPPVPLLAGEYIFGWSSLNAQTCVSASCGLGIADVGDYEVFFEFTNNGDADGYGVVGHGSQFPPLASSQPINNTKTTDYAMAIFAEGDWTTIGTTLGATNTTFTDTSPPVGEKSYRVLAFNDAGTSHPPTLVHNPQNVFLRQMTNTTDFFLVDVNGELMGLNIGEVVTLGLAVVNPPSNVTVSALAITKDVKLSWTEALLQAYWTFTQTSGDLLVDSLSVIDDADSTSISFLDQSNTGIIGNGYRSDTSGGAEIIIGGDKEDWNFLGRSDWTFNAWINSDEIGGFNTNIFDTTISNNEGVKITYNSNNSPQLKMGVTIFDDGVTVFSGSADTGYLIKNDQTFHMYSIVVREGIGIDFYRDAVLHTSTSNTNSFNIESTDRLPRFFSTGSEDQPDVNYDEFSFWEGALSSADITSLYNSGSGLSLTQSFLDSLDSSTATDYIIQRRFSIDPLSSTVEVNTNGTWQFREQEVNATPVFEPFCNFDTQADAIKMRADSNASNKLEECYVFKEFPRSFLNGTRIQAKVEVNDNFGSGVAGSITVTARNEPFQLQRADESEWAETSGQGRNFAGNSVALIDFQTLPLNTVIIEDLVDNLADWNEPDSDYVDIVFEVRDTTILAQDSFMRIFWINITDFTTGNPVAFYNFTGVTVNDEGSVGCPSGHTHCDKGTYTAGSVTVGDFVTIDASLATGFQGVFNDDFGTYATNATGDAVWIQSPTDCLSGTGGANNFCGVNATSNTLVSKWSNSGANLITYDLSTNEGFNVTDASGVGDFTLLWDHLEDDLGSAIGNNYIVSISDKITDRNGFQDAICFRFVGSQAPLDTQVTLALADGEPCTQLDDFDINVEDGDADIGLKRFFNLTRSGGTVTADTFTCEERTLACRISAMSASIGGETYNDLRYIIVASISSGSVPTDFRYDYDNFQIFIDGSLVRMFIDRDVPRGVDLTYRVIPTNSAGNATSNNADVFTNDVPKPPTVVLTPFVTSMDIALTEPSNKGLGNPSTGVEPFSFRIFKENTTDATPFALFGNFAGTTTLVTDNAVDPAKTYTYNVEFVNALGSSINATDTTTTLQTFPSTITDLSTTPVGDQCNLSWTLPFDGGATINGHRIQVRIDGGSFIDVIANTTNANVQFNHTSLVVGSTYEYDVRALNFIGEAFGSNIASCVPEPAGIPPDPPTALGLTNVGVNVKLDWVAPSQSVDGYKIERKVEQSAFAVLVFDTGNTDVTFTDTTIPALGTEVTYRVRSLNFFGESAPSGEATIVSSNPPNKPTLMADQVGSMITLTWTLPTSDGTVNGFKIERQVNFGGFTDLVSNTTNTLLTFDDSAVSKPNTYSYRVSAHDDIPSTGATSNQVDVVFGSHVQVLVREQDGSSFKGGGDVRVENSTFSLTKALDSMSNVVFDNLDTGSYNFTFIDLDDFILNKTINNVFPSALTTDTFTINALVFDVNCPVTIGSDIRIKMNYTNIQDITAFPASPVCDSSDKVSWSTTWDSGTGTASTVMVADFISARFQTNAENFLVSLVPTATIYSDPLNRIISSSFNITTTSPTTINFDLFLGDAPPSSPSPSTSPSPSGASSIPSLKVIFEQRLTGLTLLSLSHMFIQPNDIINGIITIGWDGEMPMSINRIDVGEFTDLIRITERPPFVLPQVTEGAGETARSEAEVAYQIFIPPAFCDPDVGILLNCLEREIIAIPVTFTFEFEGQEFIGQTEVILDAREIPIDVSQLTVIALGIVVIASAFVGNSLRMRFKKKNVRKRKIKKKFDSS